MPFGFRVQGPTTSRRRPIDYNAALTAYAGCDEKAEVGVEAYLSAFQFGNEFLQYVRETGSTRGYDGPCWAPRLPFDFDNEDDLDSALNDARRLAASALERYRTLDESDVLLFFSGSKGAHVELPITGDMAPSTTFHRVARRLAEALASEVGVKIDSGVYDKVRLFRAPNSRHPKTGLYKRRLTFGELLHLNANGVRQLAAAPEPFDLPRVVAADSRASADWQGALRAVENEGQVKAERRAALKGGTARLNRQTLDFIRDGASKGDRHRLLFSAAANLAEFGCPPALAHALLTEAARNSGLAPTDVRRQIECGLSQAGKEVARA
jgi:hypothetical protein